MLKLYLKLYYGLIYTLWLCQMFRVWNFLSKCISAFFPDPNFHNIGLIFMYFVLLIKCKIIKITLYSFSLVQASPGVRGFTWGSQTWIKVRMKSDIPIGSPVIVTDYSWLQQKHIHFCIIFIFTMLSMEWKQYFCSILLLPLHSKVN